MDITLAPNFEQEYSLAFLKEYAILPLVDSSGMEYLGCREEMDNAQRDAIHLLLGKHVEIKQLEVKQFDRIAGKAFSGRVKNLDPKEEDFLLELIEEADRIGGSDIHIEPNEFSGRIRIRVDGALIKRYSVQEEDYPVLVNQIKVMAGMDIAQRRAAQDGRIDSGKLKGKNKDLRVSSLPTAHGEKLVLRLLKNDRDFLSIPKLGFNKSEIQEVRKSLLKSKGLILVSGPTGSGKTTTLYAALKELNHEDINILTIEDPIEYKIEGINQVQVNPEANLSFANALRSFLRQDPDIIMVGEIRDKETAQIALRAALTGHLVLSTIHTNSALGVYNRLLDLEVPSYLIRETLSISIAQRLLRRLCDACKEEEHNAQELPFLNGLEVTKNYAQAMGCLACNYSGYTGRKAVYEIALPNWKDDGGLQLLGESTIRDKVIQELKARRISLKDAMKIITEG